MITQIIPAGAHKTRKTFKKDGDRFLNVSEFYCNTIQGEGATLGYPAAFLRLQGCTMSCSYCDSKEVWKHGSRYSFIELFNLMDSVRLPNKLKNGQHLVFTGGSPLLQQEKIVEFLWEFNLQYGFLPFVEIENECVIKPNINLLSLVKVWNNSPKLINSGVSAITRYQKDVLMMMSRLPDSWFKFVIQSDWEWREIDEFYLKPGLIRKDQVILMPMGETIEELVRYREIVFKTAVTHGVRYCTREHIILWDKKVGV